MPDDNTININENMGMKDRFKDTLDELEKTPLIIDALDELEKKIDKVNENIPPIQPPLTKEEKIEMMNMIFPIQLGDKVKNKHNEEGYVESVCIDRRGVMYLVGYQKHELIWESEYQIKKISPYSANEEVSHKEKSIKTDIPD
jgi:alpha-glucuronidase